MGDFRKTNWTIRGSVRIGIMLFRLTRAGTDCNGIPNFLAFAAPEYIFYWCLIISLALLAQGTWAWLKRGASSE